MGNNVHVTLLLGSNKQIRSKDLAFSDLSVLCLLFTPVVKTTVLYLLCRVVIECICFPLKQMILYFSTKNIVLPSLWQQTILVFSVDVNWNKFYFYTF